MKAFIVTILILMPIALMSAQPDSSGVIEVEINKIRNSEGQLRISLFETENGFPGEYKKARQFLNLDISGGSVLAVFEDVPYGNYAVAVLHDEDQNNKLTTNWLGIPKEGIAVSNNARSLFGAPSFEDARFELNKRKMNLEIDLYYF